MVPNGLLRPGVPDLALFPRAVWRRAYERALATLPDSGLGYGDPAGAPLLRGELAGYLGRVRAARVSANNLLVTTGAAQAFALFAGALRRTGMDRIGVEEPGSRAVNEQLAVHGLAIVPVPVDAYSSARSARPWRRRCDSAGCAPRRPGGTRSRRSRRTPTWAGRCSNRWRSRTCSPAAGTTATCGGYDRHLRRARRVHRVRRDALLAALRRHLPGARVTGVAAGLHLLVELLATVGRPRSSGRNSRAHRLS